MSVAVEPSYFYLSLFARIYLYLIIFWSTFEGMFAASKLSSFLPRLYGHHQLRLLQQLRPANPIPVGDELQGVNDKLLKLSTSWYPTDIIKSFQLQRRRAALMEVRQEARLAKEDARRAKNDEVKGTLQSSLWSLLN